MVLNIVLVGFFGAVTGLLDPDALRQAVASSVPESFRELNLRAFDKGFANAPIDGEVEPWVDCLEHEA